MEILKVYGDKAYITTVLCDLSYNYYSFIYNISLLPTILGSSILTILNSSMIEDTLLKKINIAVNGLNTVILALVNSYRLNDRINTFKNIKIKFNKLTHLIESITNKNSEGEIDKITIENIINEYDRLYEDLVYQFPHHIKQKIMKKFGGVWELPNSLAIDYIENNRLVQSDIVISKDSIIFLKYNIVINDY